MNIEEERRHHLSDYYLATLVCSTCGKEYGSDAVKRDNNVCPICDEAVMDRKSILTKNLGGEYDC